MASDDHQPRLIGGRDNGACALDAVRREADRPEAHRLAQLQLAGHMPVHRYGLSQDESDNRSGETLDFLRAIAQQF